LVSTLQSKLESKGQLFAPSGPSGHKGAAYYRAKSAYKAMLAAYMAFEKASKLANEAYHNYNRNFAIYDDAYRGTVPSSEKEIDYDNAIDIQESVWEAFNEAYAPDNPIIRDITLTISPGQGDFTLYIVEYVANGVTDFAYFNEEEDGAITYFNHRESWIGVDGIPVPEPPWQNKITEWFYKEISCQHPK